jgi:hypothetical protein
MQKTEGVSEPQSSDAVKAGGYQPHEYCEHVWKVQPGSVSRTA